MSVRDLRQWRNIIKEAWNGTFNVAKFLLVIHVTRTHFCVPAALHGPSMLPTFKLTGDNVLVERISTQFGLVRPGDIVVARSPENPLKMVTKRVMGMEGDAVTFVVDPKNSDDCDTIIVPKGHVWIEGDNIYDSRDSRNFGPIPHGLLVGRVFWQIWPPKSFGSINRRPVSSD